ncbi:MAG: LuxR family transcriptional regulator, partial [Dactylosporangium sp.]|nr:LuxR family transcriptional regulator [Dactylosporangium sp.]
MSAAVTALADPGLVVLASAPGGGRSTLLRQIAEAFRGPVFAGGGLAMLRTTPALGLSRALRVRLPVHDVALLAEAVRSRVRRGLLVLDDLQWADALTLDALPALGAHCRIVAAVRLPHRIPPAAVETLRQTATW